MITYSDVFVGTRDAMVRAASAGLPWGFVVKSVTSESNCVLLKGSRFAARLTVTVEICPQEELQEEVSRGEGHQDLGGAVS